MENKEIEIIDRAIKLARKYHGAQMYGEHSYMYHLQNVAKLAILIDPQSLNNEERINAICSAWLHDILEDTNCPESEIIEACNPEVLEIVKCLSNDCENERMYFEKVAQNKIAIFVKVCDRISNVRECLRNGSAKINKYKRQNQMFHEILFRSRFEFAFNYLAELIN